MVATSKYIEHLKKLDFYCFELLVIATAYSASKNNLPSIIVAPEHLPELFVEIVVAKDIQALSAEQEEITDNREHFYNIIGIVIGIELNNNESDRVQEIAGDEEPRMGYHQECQVTRGLLFLAHKWLHFLYSVRERSYS